MMPCHAHAPCPCTARRRWAFGGHEGAGKPTRTTERQLSSAAFRSSARTRNNSGQRSGEKKRPTRIHTYHHHNHHHHHHHHHHPPSRALCRPILAAITLPLLYIPHHQSRERRSYIHAYITTTSSNGHGHRQQHHHPHTHVLSHIWRRAETDRARCDRQAQIRTGSLAGWLASWLVGRTYFLLYLHVHER
ncbi:hypothetical protein FN846DRAFT_192740 [Sphaerosporella brunnea]|uniref:Uncharacterized protein n=1 Tax=Sphaerosporella brunnea TaxID=1250544 RepID=A0A5J5EPV7_9PEZI|nr:hypothetical protein FN846DRAFT_192740 [Sphaerosporella brunnea]